MEIHTKFMFFFCTNNGKSQFVLLFLTKKKMGIYNLFFFLQFLEFSFVRTKLKPENSEMLTRNMYMFVFFLGGASNFLNSQKIIVIHWLQPPDFLFINHSMVENTFKTS